MRFARLVVCVAAFAAWPLAAFVSSPPALTLPAAFRDIAPHTLSSGLYLSLAADGHFGGLASRLSARSTASGTDKGLPPAILDARVGDNIRLGTDPAGLPTTQRSQAEPHLWRSAANPEVLVATFQEGRFASGGGALDCGYGVSTDGGISWTRALIPNLTTASGGTYVRATDPVAAIDLEGRVFLATLAARQTSFNDGGVVVVSRSTDRGATFSTPAVVAAGTATTILDKEWLAVNDYAGTPHANRLVVTWTAIDTNTNSYDLFSAFSDDAGASWSTPLQFKTKDSAIDQATFPVFLPDGSLLVPYITALTNTGFRIECKRSADGGATFPATPTVVVSSVSLWNDSSLRSGTFIINAWVARESGHVFLTYVGRDTAGQPHVYVTRSTDRGASWSAPVVASDNREGVSAVSASVVNAAVASSPDGQRVTVTYYDKRHNPAGADDVVDLYTNLSFDGGATWSAGLRLTEYSIHFRSAPLTGDGYMLGDYQAIAPPVSADQPAVAITVDTRDGDPDPGIIRYALDPTVSFDAWRLARFSHAEFARSDVSGAAADPDGDRTPNLLEYVLATDPRIAAYGSPYLLQAYPLAASVYHVLRGDGVALTWETSSDATTWTPLDFSSRLEDMPTPGPIIWRLVGGNFAFPAAAPRYLREVFTLGSTRLTGELISLQSDARLVNVSTRGQVKTGESQLIVGFVTAGGAKQILVRGVGPTLGPLGVAQPLPDPQLELQAPGSPLFTRLLNNDWGQSSATSVLFARLGATALLDGSRDAALVASLAARPYSAVLSDTAGRSGLALVEAYDADATPGAPDGPALVNLSSRGEVGTGENILIGGFVITGTRPKRVLLRAVGPTLADHGVVAVLADPVLSLYRSVDGHAQFVASNDDWQLAPSVGALMTAATHTGAFELRTGASRDAALLLTLEPGVYTAQVASVDGSSGVALVEIYDAD